MTGGLFARSPMQHLRSPQSNQQREEITTKLIVPAVHACTLTHSSANMLIFRDATSSTSARDVNSQHTYFYQHLFIRATDGSDFLFGFLFWIRLRILHGFVCTVHAPRLHITQTKRKIPNNFVWYSAWISANPHFTWLFTAQNKCEEMYKEAIIHGVTYTGFRLCCLLSIRCMIYNWNMPINYGHRLQEAHGEREWEYAEWVSECVCERYANDRILFTSSNDETALAVAIIVFFSSDMNRIGWRRYRGFFFIAAQVFESDNCLWFLINKHLSKARSKQKKTTNNQSQLQNARGQFNDR